jgi:hypothetical protein
MPFTLNPFAVDGGSNSSISLTWHCQNFNIFFLPNKWEIISFCLFKFLIFCCLRSGTSFQMFSNFLCDFPIHIICYFSWVALFFKCLYNMFWILIIVIVCIANISLLRTMVFERVVLHFMSLRISENKCHAYPLFLIQTIILVISHTLYLLNKNIQQCYPFAPLYELEEKQQIKEKYRFC